MSGDKRTVIVNARPLAELVKEIGDLRTALMDILLGSQLDVQGNRNDDGMTDALSRRAVSLHDVERWTNVANKALDS